MHGAQLFDLYGRSSSNTSKPAASATASTGMCVRNIFVVVEKPHKAPNSVLVRRLELVSTNATNAVVAVGERSTKRLHGCEMKSSVVESLISLHSLPVPECKFAMKRALVAKEALDQPSTLMVAQAVIPPINQRGEK